MNFWSNEVRVRITLFKRSCTLEVAVLTVAIRNGKLTGDSMRKKSGTEIEKELIFSMSRTVPTSKLNLKLQ